MTVRWHFRGTRCFYISLRPCFRTLILESGGTGRVSCLRRRGLGREFGVLGLHVRCCWCGGDLNGRRQRSRRIGRHRNVWCSRRYGWIRHLRICSARQSQESKGESSSMRLSPEVHIVFLSSGFGITDNAAHGRLRDRAVRLRLRQQLFPQRDHRVYQSTDQQALPLPHRPPSQLSHRACGNGAFHRIRAIPAHGALLPPS